MNHHRSRRRRKLRVALLLGLAAAACGRPTDHETAPPGPSLGAEDPILVDDRWKLGYDGKPQRRAVWVSGDDEVAGTRWQGIEIEPGIDAGGEDWYARCMAYRDHCHVLSVEAFDRLQAATGGALPASEYASKYGRKDHLVLPSPDGTRAVIMDWRDGARGIIELPSGRELGWPTDVVWGSGHKIVADTPACWSGDSSRLAFVTADDAAGKSSSLRIIVLDVVDFAVVTDLPAQRGVYELAWSPDGLRLAVLARESRLGTGPIERLAANIGHGRPYSDVYVQIIDLGSGEVAESLLASDLPEDSPHIVWDPRAVTARTGWEQP